MSRQLLALSIIRIAVSGNMLIHGIARIAINGVTPFDDFLISHGFPPYSAWIITLFEIFASIGIILNKWILPLSALFLLELLAGILMVHLPNGWFVVGAGRNGMEYSVLLMVGFASLIIANYKNR